MTAIARLKQAHGTPLRIVIRANGTIEKLEHPIGLPGAHKAIKATGLDTVLLYDRTHVMLVDDNGIEKMLPVNTEATALYLDRCYPGATHQIHGDVVVVPDSDFAGSPS